MLCPRAGPAKPSAPWSPLRASASAPVSPVPQTSDCSCAPRLKAPCDERRKSPRGLPDIEGRADASDKMVPERLQNPRMDGEVDLSRCWLDRRNQLEIEQQGRTFPLRLDGDPHGKSHDELVPEGCGLPLSPSKQWKGDAEVSSDVVLCAWGFGLSFQAAFLRRLNFRPLVLTRLGCCNRSRKRRGLNGRHTCFGWNSRSNDGFCAFLCGPRMGSRQNIMAENYGYHIFVHADVIRNLSVEVDHHSGYMDLELTNANSAHRRPVAGDTFLVQAQQCAAKIQHQSVWVTQTRRHIPQMTRPLDAHLDLLTGPNDLNLFNRGLRGKSRSGQLTALLRRCRFRPSPSPGSAPFDPSGVDCDQNRRHFGYLQ